MTSRQHLALSLRLLGHVDRAEKLDREAVERYRATRGDSDRRTLTAIAGLAEDLLGQGRWAEVVELRPPVLEQAGRALPPGDPAVLRIRRAAGVALRRLGETREASDLLEAAYHECVENFGADHQQTLAMAVSYANALRALGRTGEAYAFAVDAASGYERVFGAGNPLTLAAYVNLAVIFRARGERAEARRADEAALAGLRDSVGERHPFTVVAMLNTATDRAYDGDRAGAHALTLLAWRIAADVCGPHHVDTLAAAANLHVDGAADGGPDDLPPLDRVLADLRDSVGASHPLVAAAAAGTRVECDLEPATL